MKHTVKIEFYFGDVDKDADIQTDGVPLTMIVEALHNMQNGLCKKIVEEAQEVIPDDELNEYLDARFKLDREMYMKKFL